MTQTPSAHPSRSEPAAPAPKATWRMADVIDFEFFLDQDRHRPATELEARDRTLYVERIKPCRDEGNPRHQSRSWLFRQWLALLRERQAPDQPLPGALLANAWSLLTKVATVVMLALGAAAAAQLLQYEGEQPVNVAAYFGCFVILQLLLLVLAVAVYVLRQTSFLAAEMSLLTGLLRWIWTSLGTRMHRHLLERSEGHRRLELRAFLGAAASRSQPYRFLPVWPLAALLQWLGACFNVGVLLTTLGLVLFFDRAFGWQSAVPFTAEQVHALTQTLALPWSWIFPEGIGAPTLEQIEGSRIVLKDGIRKLATANLVSWWPFLCLATTVYGLLPRLLLFLLCWIQKRRALARLTFDNVACDRLHERLTTPNLQSQGMGTEPSSPDSSSEGEPSRSLTSEATGTDRRDTAIALLEPELLEGLNEDRLRRQLQERFPLEVGSIQAVGINPIDLRPALPRLRESRQAQAASAVILVQEAWEPPIAERLQALRLLRETWPAPHRLIVVLIGRPAGANPLTPVPEADRQIWEKKLAALGDPHLRVDCLLNHG